MKKITVEELCQKPVGEGLILQGCGGDLQEWVDGVNEMFTEEQILRNGDRFKEVFAFEHKGLTNMLFSMDSVDLDIGRLAMWRLRTHESFGGTWMSDYLTNQFGIDHTVSEEQQMGGYEI